MNPIDHLNWDETPSSAELIAALETPGGLLRDRPVVRLLLGGLCCEECGEWSIRGLGWKAYTLDEGVVFYCRSCADVEFGDA